MNARAGSRDAEGSTVVEMLLAAVLTMIAFALLTTDAVPAIRALEAAGQPDRRRVELIEAAEVVARAVRAARPVGMMPAVGGDARHLNIGAGPEGALRFTLEGGALILDVHAANRGSSAFPTGILVAGLDMERSGFWFIESDTTGTVGESPIAVVIHLADGSSDIVRVATLRLRDPLDGASAW